MARVVRKLLAFLMIAALVCGNTLVESAQARGHSTVDHGVGAMGDHHGHDHGHARDAAGHDHGATAHRHDVSDSHGGMVAAACPDGVCPTDETPGGACHSVHAHCCCTPGLPQTSALIGPLDRAMQKLSPISRSLPPGGVVHPLLRPPRAVG